MRPIGTPSTQVPPSPIDHKTPAGGGGKVVVQFSNISKRDNFTLPLDGTTTMPDVVNHIRRQCSVSDDVNVRLIVNGQVVDWDLGAYHQTKEAARLEGRNVELQFAQDYKEFDQIVKKLRGDKVQVFFEPRV